MKIITNLLSLANIPEKVRNQSSNQPIQKLQYSLNIDAEEIPPDLRRGNRTNILDIATRACLADHETVEESYLEPSDPRTM